MVEKEGRVVIVEKDACFIEIIKQSTCFNCIANANNHHDYGEHSVNKDQLQKNNAYIRITNNFSLEQNDKVVIGIPENFLIKVSIFIYCLPLMNMMSALWLTSWIGCSDLLIFISVLISLSIGFLPVRALGNQYNSMIDCIKVDKIIKI